MNFYNIIQNILDTSSKHKNVKEVSEGDIYVYLNSGEHKYPCVFLTVGEVTDSEMSRNVNCTLFYVDRLSSDQSNRTVVQSLGITTLGDILDTIEGDVVSVNYTTFTEKFADMCAGVFATVDITYPLGEVCDEHFEVRRLEITENGIYDTIGYDEFVIEVVNEELAERVEELQQEVEEYITNIEQKEVEISQLEEEVSIKEKQINSVTSLSITENGNYTPEEGILGWNEVSVQLEKPVFKVKNGVKLNNYGTEFPFDIDSTEMTDFDGMFNGCEELITIPQIDTSKGTDFSFMFSQCRKLITIPLIDTSKGTNFNKMFEYCNNLTTIPQIDTSKGTNFSSMFLFCSNLTSIPQLDTSSGTTVYSMFENCSKLTSIPQLDTSSSTHFGCMFENCYALKSIPQLDTSNSTQFDRMFSGCRSLTSIPQLDTSIGTYFIYMFQNCYSLTTISQLDISKGTNFNNMFTSCNKLENINLVGSINYSISFVNSSSLSYESVKSILTACSNTTNTNSKTLKFRRTLTDQNGELAALVATCNSKGWTISGLTLN